MHLLDRTSPQGVQFLGCCRKCGKENVTIAVAMDDVCPVESSPDDDVVDAIESQPGELEDRGGRL